MTATEAAAAVIALSPARLVSAARFRELIASAPVPDEDFARDVRKLRASVRAPGAA